jgi:hypothetical protein
VKCVVAQQIKIVAQMQPQLRWLHHRVICRLAEAHILHRRCGFSIQYCQSLVSQTTVCAVLSSAVHTQQVHFTD